MTPREIIAEALKGRFGFDLHETNEIAERDATDAILAGLKAMLPKEDEVIVKREASAAVAQAYRETMALSNVSMSEVSRIWTAMIQASEKEG